MEEPSDFSRLRAALRAVSPASNLASLKDSYNVGCFDLLHADTLSTVQVYRKQSVPKTLYLNLESMETSPPYNRGHGVTALLSLFDLTDKAGIQALCVTACDIGRYMFAASYAHCNAQHWPMLQKKLLDRLDDYPNSDGGTHHPQRVEQAAMANRIIRTSQGQLGEIVAQLRVPVIGEAVQPTLAKLLFLPEIKGDEYDAYWMKAERDMARHALRRPIIEPLAQPIRKASELNMSAPQLRIS